MAAPNGIVWGSIYAEKGRIGIYTKVTNTDTQTSVNVQVWIWTRYSCYDSNNNLYYDAGKTVTAASTNIGSVSFNHTVNSSWSTSNQSKILEKNYTYTRGSSAATYNVYAKLAGIDWVEEIMYANTSYTVPALTTTYLVTYNVNGGTGAPSTQIKTHGINLILSNDKPTKTGYTFVNWLSSAQNKTYNPGALYDYDQNTTMTAQWTANTYTVSYNANGGENAPSNQTKTHGIDLTLTNSIPTRTNYNFLGWGTSSSSTTVEYSAGGTYSNNVSITLYAIWELAYSNPSINSVVVSRCDSSGVTNDYGEYVKVSFAWSCDQNLGSNPISSITIKYRKTSETSNTPTTVTASGTSGTVNQIIGSGNISVDSSYIISITVIDSLNGTTTVARTIGSSKFPIDVLAGGLGVSIGKPAIKGNALDVDFDIYANKELYDKIGQKITNGLAEYLSPDDGFIDPNETLSHIILTAHANSPMGEGIFYYIVTLFFSGKSTSAYRAQFGIPYNQNGSMYYRYFNGSWSAWHRNVNENENVVTSDCFSYSNGILTITVP